MYCKYCGAQLEEDTTLCPACQKDNAEQPAAALEEELVVQQLSDEEPITPEAEKEEMLEETTDDEGALPYEIEAEAEAVQPEAPKKPKIWLIILAIVGGIAVLAVLVGAVLYGLGIDLEPKENNIFCKESYTIVQEKAEKASQQQIATAGGKVLDNAQLQVYYNMTVNDFVEYYGYYLTSIGLDTTKPLDEQACMLEEGLTWQQYFLNNSLNVWHRYTVLNLLAQEDNLTLDATLQEQLDQLPQQVSAWAAQYGFEDAQAMLQADFGPICTMDAYMDYMTGYYMAMQYQNEKYALLEPTAEEVEVYFTANEEMFAQNNITKESGSYYDVRHILIGLEGGTKDASGQTVYSDEEWANCLAKAEQVLGEWESGEATEDSFAQMAASYSTDSGSSSNGGLYTQLTSETNFVEEFKQWYLDESRKPGDTGIVKSVYGYHIMFFSGSEEIWRYNAKTTLLSEKWNTLIEEAMVKWPMEVTYKNIALCDRVEQETAETETTGATETTAPTQTTAATEEPTAAPTE